MSSLQVERPVEEEPRFGFGENWRRFAADLTSGQIEAARDAISAMLGLSSLEGVGFLDIGSGSGLSSLAAVELGAERVHSLDYDPASVETTSSLRARFAPNAAWTVDRGDALDRGHMRSLGRWDVVYSWGVLHHTGNLWEALDIAIERVAVGGRFFVAIYNDQGWRSRLWRRIKRLYASLPAPVRPLYALIVMAPMELKMLLARTLRGRPNEYFRLWRARDERGMDRWRDIVDWVGGYPFEVARPDEVVAFCRARGLALVRLESVAPYHGCNQFVFARSGDTASA